MLKNKENAKEANNQVQNVLKKLKLEDVDAKKETMESFVKKGKEATLHL